MRDAQKKNGIYLPNTPTMSMQAADKFRRGNFSWAVRRPELHPEYWRWMQEIGVTIIMQGHDHFSGEIWRSPAETAIWTIQRYERERVTDELIVPDNEPNLQHPLSQWHAEQWDRYYRAYKAIHTWKDHEGHYPLITPAFSPQLPDGLQMYEEVFFANVQKPLRVGLHCYWQTREQLGDQIRRVAWWNKRADVEGFLVYILEYCNTDSEVNSTDKAHQYRLFLQSLGDKVECACLFILDGTPDWKQQFPDATILDALASV